MKNIRKYVAIACLAMQGSVPVLAQDKTFTVQVDQPIAPINQNMWGIFLRISIWVPMGESMLN